MQYLDSWKSLLKVTEILSHPRYRHLEDMGKAEIISVQYHHKCRSISNLKKMLKALSENEHTMGVCCPAYLLHKIKEMLEGPKYETTFHTVFRAACR